MKRAEIWLNKYTFGYGNETTHMLGGCEVKEIKNMLYVLPYIQTYVIFGISSKFDRMSDICDYFSDLFFYG